VKASVLGQLEVSVVCVVEVVLDEVTCVVEVAVVELQAPKVKAIKANTKIRQNTSFFIMV